MTASFDPFERLPRALHSLAQAPAGLGWNHHELADLLPADKPLRPAAVLIALIERADGPRVLLTVRSQALRDHAGQVSFPGGRVEADDSDPVAAALREAQEEVGLSAALASPLGYLDPFVTITGFHVFPVVARVCGSYVPRLDPSEVAASFEVPLDFLLDAANVHELEVDWQGRRRRLLEYRYQQHRIWGATASMLVNFRHRLEQA